MLALGSLKRCVLSRLLYPVTLGEQRPLVAPTASA